MSEIWVHNEIRVEVEFLKKRIDEQRVYIKEIKDCQWRSPERKAELIASAKSLKDQYHNQLGEYLTQGLIALI